MVKWFDDLNWRERNTVQACFAAWSCDGFDVQMFAFVMPALLAAWHVTTTQASVMTTVALLGSALGGWICGALADRFGRVRLLQATILWYAGFTFLCGFAQDFQQLFLLRVLQGLGAGGVWAVATVLVGETVRDPSRGRAVGWVQAGWPLGWGAAAVLYLIILAVLPEAIAWRVLFWFGLAPALLVLWVHNNLDEPDLSQLKGPGLGARLLAPFRQPHGPIVWRVVLMTAGAQGSSYAILTYVPIYLRNVRHLAAVGTGAYLFALILGCFCGIAAGGYLADRVGRKAPLLLSLFGSAILMPAAMLAPVSSQIILPIGFVLGFVNQMMLAPMGTIMTELFPAAIRGGAQGFGYNAGRGIAAIVPALVGLLSAHTGFGGAIAILGLVGFTLMLTGLMLLPETRGRLVTGPGAGAQHQADDTQPGDAGDEARKSIDLWRRAQTRGRKNHHRQR